MTFYQCSPCRTCSLGVFSFVSPIVIRHRVLFFLSLLLYFQYKFSGGEDIVLNYHLRSHNILLINVETRNRYLKNTTLSLS